LALKPKRASRPLSASPSLHGVTGKALLVALAALAFAAPAHAGLSVLDPARLGLPRVAVVEDGGGPGPRAERAPPGVGAGLSCKREAVTYRIRR
jgi:hypothetical protein